MELTTHEFLRFREFLKNNSGILLPDSKQYLVTNRLRPLMKEVGMDDLSDLLSMIEAMPDKELAAKVIDVMTTDETFWFKDSSHFRFLETTVLPEMLESSPQLTIWSAACSSGQEPFSISLSIDKALKKSAKKPYLKIIATDVSDKALSKAKVGVYSDVELTRGMPNSLKNEHFTGVRDGWQIASSHRSRVTFGRLNLLKDFSNLGQFDIVFCRNVLMYFAVSAKTDILNRITSLMKQGAYLFLSSSETLPAEIKNLEVIRNADCKCYRKI
ncbi:MAG: chemotaxis protein methyltransferase CheR [Cycloclasticus sp.]|jgi:chemotaxis protein methyltransferase CheR